MPTACRTALHFGTTTIHRNLATARLVELSLQRGEGVLASNGAF